MTPELLPEDVIQTYLVTGLVISVGALAFGVWNFIEAWRRIKGLGYVEEERTRLIAVGIVREGLFTLFIGSATLTFSIQALIGDFNLTRGWFSYVFMFCLYAGAIGRLLTGFFSRLDRVKLDRIHNEASGRLPAVKPPRG